MNKDSFMTKTDELMAMMVDWYGTTGRHPKGMIERNDKFNAIRAAIVQALADARDEGMLKGAVWGLAKATQPQPEPVGWLDAPYAAFRANPKFQWEKGPTVVAASIPLYLPTDTQPEPVQEPVTMDSLYGDGSDHQACRVCGYCVTCGDCPTYHHTSQPDPLTPC